jgi:SAM-dependent methyltransferase
MRGDPFYLHLSDLLIAMKTMMSQKFDRILDFGCGGSPYRELFDAPVYHRADLTGGEFLDFEFGADSKLPAEVASGYDCILSSQVLEHVISPEAYLRECHRVLRPGGSLILSTHGSFPDHECPGDFWRWTAAGLGRLVQSAGFSVKRVQKVTTGPRAAVFIKEQAYLQANIYEGGANNAAILISFMGLPFWRWSGAPRRHRACDESFPHYRVVDADAPGHELYVAITLHAVRLGGSRGATVSDNASVDPQEPGA